MPAQATHLHVGDLRRGCAAVRRGHVQPVQWPSESNPLPSGETAKPSMPPCVSPSWLNVVPASVLSHSLAGSTP
jgi:hypothetical protein